MSWPISLSVDETEQNSDAVIEGTIVHSYDDIIPGTSPGIQGTHILFGVDCKLVRSSIAPSIADSVRSVGIWILRNDFYCKIGARVRVHCVIHLNTQGFQVFMPVPCSHFGIVESESIESLHFHFDAERSQLWQGSIRQKPFTLETWTSSGFPPDINSMEERLGGNPLLGLDGDAIPTFEIWRTAWRVPSNGMTFVLRINPQPPPGGVYYYDSHYRVVFASIPPSSPGRPSPWASTQSPAPSDRAYPCAKMMHFNSEKIWSAVDQNAQSGQGDFKSILAHELGHAMGLGHLNGNVNNIMYESIGAGTIRTTLQIADVNAISNLYA